MTYSRLFTCDFLFAPPTFCTLNLPSLLPPYPLHPTYTPTLFTPTPPSASHLYPYPLHPNLLYPYPLHPHPTLCISNFSSALPPNLLHPTIPSARPSYPLHPYPTLCTLPSAPPPETITGFNKLTNQCAK